MLRVFFPRGHVSTASTLPDPQDYRTTCGTCLGELQNYHLLEGGVLGFKVGLGFRVWGLGFRVQTVGFRV